MVRFTVLLVLAAAPVAAGWLAPTPARAQSAPEDLLPDVVVNPDALGEMRMDTATVPGHRLLRLSASTPNIGRGPLEIRAGISPGTDPTVPSPVLQRIYRSDGSFWDRAAGTEVFDADHAHVHFDTWAQYRLRALNPDHSPGEIVAQSDKTSFCLLDLVPFDPSNRFFANPGHYGSCGLLIQGISPGWADVYDLEIPKQWIDITGVPDGEYWLEAEVDPDQRVLESDESNNVARIRIQTGAPPPALPDAYEENDDPSEVDQQPVGVAPSANLGPLITRVEIDDLSMEDDADYFKFQLSEVARGGVLRIESPYPVGDLDLVLLDAQGNLLGASASLGNLEQVSLAGLGPGDYYAWVLGSSTPNPRYRLILDPGSNQPPAITLTSPPPPGVFIELAFESLPLSWAVTDPEGDPTTVALAIDRDQVIDKQTIRPPAYQRIDGRAGGASLLSEGFGLGRWYLRAEVSDGRGMSAAWAPGWFFVYVKGDVNFDGVVDGADWKQVHRALAHGGALPPGWDHILDLNRDGAVDPGDIRELRERAASSRSCGRP